MERARPATTADLGRVVALFGQLHDELGAMRGGGLWAAREARREPVEASLASQLDDPNACVLVGLIDDVVVGFGVIVIETLSTGEQLGRITELYVEEPARAVSVGEAINDGLLAFASEHDVVGVDALALPGHRAAKNFFEEQGFTARALVMHRSTPPR